MSYLKTEAWSLEDISNSLTKMEIDDRRIVVPIFQRGKRWNDADKKNFIDSLKKNYPIGSLLFFKKRMNDEDIYILIDGLQRSSTIKEYLKNPTSFFNPNQVDVSTWNSIEKLVNNTVSSEPKELINVKDIIIKYICELPSFDKFDTIELCKSISISFPEFKNGDVMMELNNILKPTIEGLQKSYKDLSQVEIPVIVYTGPENTLPEIFERINKEGHPLEEYDIYSASWPEDKFHIENEDIISYILKKYDMLSDDDYYIDNYNRDDFRIKKNVNAFEYIFGFSKWITNKFKTLSFKTTVKEDVANPVGFELLNACFNTSHNQIKDLYKTILKFKNKIVELEKALVYSIEYVENHIAAITKFKGNTHGKEYKILHSQFQIMSLISFVFRCKYDINTLNELDSWNDTEKKISENIIKYYVYDILNKTWADGGTNKIHTANAEKRYLTPLTKGQFVSVLDSLNEERLNGRHEAKFVKQPEDKDYVILNTIYLKSFTALDQLSIDKFDVEHIATKDLMKRLIKITNGEHVGLPISHMANLCYLPEDANRIKQDYTFYQDKEWLKKTGYDLSEIENKYSFTSKEDLDWVDLDYQENDFDVLKEYYFDFLRERYRKLKEKFLLALDYDLNDLENDTVKNINYKEDDYYRLTKIGQLVQESIIKLMKGDLLSKEDLKDLQDKDFCLNELGCAFPVLVANKEKTSDSNGRIRYYNEPIEYKGTNYYLCKEWYESDRKKFVPWLKNILSTSIND